MVATPTRDKQLSALCPRLVLGVWALDRGAIFAQWRGCLPGALSRSQEPRNREQLTTTLIHRCKGLSARRRIRIMASHGAPREWCFEQRRAAVFWHERRARARMRVTGAHITFCTVFLMTWLAVELSFIVVFTGQGRWPSARRSRGLCHLDVRKAVAGPRSTGAPALPARGCTVPVAPPSTTTTQ